MIRKSENAVSKPVITLLVQSVRVEPLEYASAENHRETHTSQEALRNTHRQGIENHLDALFDLVGFGDFLKLT